MERTAVIYTSQTGHTKRYAKAIAKELGASLLESDKVTASKLSEFDTIIYGGYLYASGIKGIRLIKKNFEKIREKNLVVFATGLTEESAPDILQIMDENFTEEQRQRIKTFYFRGGLDMGALSFIDRTLMGHIKRKLQKMENPRVEDLIMLQAFEKPTDFTDLEKIKPLLAYVRGFS